MAKDKRVKVAVDAMGGDYAPEEIVKGAVMAAEEKDLEIALVGSADIVEAELAKHNISHLPIRCITADELITEHENPALAVRRKPNASIAVAAKMVKNGEADCLISAGPTGAVVTSAICYLGMIEGVERPVIGGAIFASTPNTVVFDCGLNIDCKPYHLLTFALLGTIYCRKLINIANPTVGLLNIGTEESKGNHLTRETHHLLKKSGLNFVGNVEGNQMMSGRANVLVCDGFIGNILFKFSESIGLYRDSAEREENPNPGGGLLWGINGIVRKVHGASRAPHLALKIHHTREAVEMDLIANIRSELGAIKEARL